MQANNASSFRWAVCQLSILSRCITIRDIRTSLQTLPDGLNETYERLLTRLAPSDVALVRKVMAWLSFSVAPITLHQLWETLCIEEETTCIDEESRLRSPQDILLLTHSLVTVPSMGYVMLAHLSVRGYLVSPETQRNPTTAMFALDSGTGHMELARDCLTYLSFSALSSGPADTQGQYVSRLEQLPLLQYAARYCFYHARSATLDADLRHQTLEFFTQERRKNFMS